MLFHFVADVFVSGVSGDAGILVGPADRQPLELVTLVIKCRESNLVWDVSYGHRERHPFIPGKGRKKYLAIQFFATLFIPFDTCSWVESRASDCCSCQRSNAVVSTRENGNA